MSPGPKDTPPPSPGFGEGEEEEELLDEGEALEVIDLDEVAGLNDDDDEGEFDEDMEEEEGSSVPPPVDNSALVFSKHEKAVFNGDFHPKSEVCVTGGEDDKAYVWNWKTGEVLLETPAFKDSVVFTKFNKDGSLLAIADMAGTIKVQKMNGNVCKEVVWEFETSDITWLEWHPGANVLFATTDDSELWMWKIPSGDSKIYLGNGEKAEGAKIMPDGKRVVVGYGDGSMRVFDLKTGDVLHNLTDGSTSHSPSPVTALDARSDNNLIASGGADGVAKIFNVQSGKNIGIFVHGKPSSNQQQMASSSNDDVIPEIEHNKSTVEALLFSPAEQNMLITGTLEGNISVWDISSQVMRHSVNVGDGVVKMTWRNGSSSAAATSSDELFVATLHGRVAVVNVKTGKVVGECSGHTEAILDFSQTSDGSRILSCSDDGDCRIFDVDQVINGHSNAAA